MPSRAELTSQHEIEILLDEKNRKTRTKHYSDRVVSSINSRNFNNYSEAAGRGEDISG